VAIKIISRGRYELYEDEHGHRFVVLGGRHWYAWIQGQKSPLLVRTGSNHRTQRVLQRGKYFYVDFKGDPEFRDLPHLFLERGDKYQELVLPNGLPTGSDPQKRLVVSRHTLPKSELENYLGARAVTPRRDRSRAARP
jgi:hypothetical protein